MIVRNIRLKFKGNAFYSTTFKDDINNTWDVHSRPPIWPGCCRPRSRPSCSHVSPAEVSANGQVWVRPNYFRIRSDFGKILLDPWNESLDRFYPQKLTVCNLGQRVFSQFFLIWMNWTVFSSFEVLAPNNNKEHLPRCQMEGDKCRILKWIHRHL